MLYYLCIMKKILTLFLVVSINCVAQKKTKQPATDWSTPLQVIEGLKPGNKAPELAYKNPNDSTISLSSLRGKIVGKLVWAM